MISICLMLLTVSSSQAGIFYRQIGDPDDDNGLMVHVYNDGSPPILTNKRDGAQIFRVHQPPLNGDTSPRAMSLESARFPGFFLYATDDNKLMLKVPKTEDDKVSATFRKHLKVQKNLYIFSVEGKQYDFMCNAKNPPYPLRIKIDDNSRFFADRCSFGFRGLTKEQADAKLKKETGVGLDGQPAGGGGAGGGAGDGGKGGPGGKGNYAKLYIPGSPGMRPTLGLKADLFQKVRIGMPPDQFIVKSPGLNGVEGTYSFESAKYPMFYLQRIGRDIYLEALKKNPDFYASSTFKITPYINKKSRYFISPYSQPEWFLGHLHVPPFYVRAMFNNNTAEFDLDASWIIKYQKDKEIFGLGTHHDLFRALIKLLSLVHGPLTASQETAIFQALHGNTDLTELGNSTAIMQLLQSQHNSLLLSQLATINGLQGLKPVAPPLSDAPLLSDATTAAGSVAGSTASSTSGSTSGAGTGGAGGAGTSGGTSGGSVTDKVAETGDKKPSTEVVVEKYEPWSDWSSCSAQCGTGHQIRVRPCKVNAQSCTPLQQSQPCVAASPCQPQPATAVAANGAHVVQTAPQAAQVVQAAPQVVQAAPQAAAIQGQAVANPAGGCPMTCSFDCNPTTCPLSCCSNLVKKQNIARVHKHIKGKLLTKKSRKHKKHHKQ